MFRCFVSRNLTFVHSPLTPPLACAVSKTRVGQDRADKVVSASVRDPQGGFFRRTNQKCFRCRCEFNIDDISWSFHEIFMISYL